MFLFYGVCSYNQFGLFAKRNLLRDEYLDVYYTGNVEASDCGNYGGTYMWEYNTGGRDYVINAEKSGNETRFMNHFTGIHSHPNVSTDCKGPFVLFRTLNPIPRGTEIGMGHTARE